MDDKQRQFVIINEHHKLEPVGDLIADALGQIVIDSASTDCTDRPSCNCHKCQTRLRKMLKDHARKIEHANSPLNRAQRRAAKRHRPR